MKKILIFLTFIAIFPCGCSGGAIASPPPETAESLSSEIPSPDALLSDEIERLLDGRRFIHTFGVVDCLSFDYSEQVSIDGKVYCKVTDNNFLKWEDWESFVCSVYAENLTDDILNTTKLVSYNGDLYTSYGVNDADLPRKREFEVTESTDSKAVVRQTHKDIFDENKVFVEEITILLTSEGWRITKIGSYTETL